MSFRDHTIRAAVLLLLLAVFGGNTQAFAQAEDFAACEQAIAEVQQASGLPDGILHAIALAETGRFDPATGRLRPWPWSIDVDGAGQFFSNRQQAIAAVQAWQAQGVHSIDVGCMQVNLAQHPDAFVSLDQAFDPQANAFYAAAFLRGLYLHTGGWQEAAGAYHSAKPASAHIYAIRVMGLWRHSFPPIAQEPLLPLSLPIVSVGVLTPNCGNPPSLPGSWLLPEHAPGCRTSYFHSTRALAYVLQAVAGGH